TLQGGSYGRKNRAVFSLRPYYQCWHALNHSRHGFLGVRPDQARYERDYPARRKSRRHDPKRGGDDAGGFAEDGVNRGNRFAGSLPQSARKAHPRTLVIDVSKDLPLRAQPLAPETDFARILPSCG